MRALKDTYELVVTGGAPSASLPVRSATQVLGSSAECALRLDHPSISPRHAQVEVVEDGVLFRDLTGQGLSRTLPSRERRCHVGDAVRLGDVTLELVDSATTVPRITPAGDGADLSGHPTVGTVIADRYELTGFIAQGGMGQVFRARHRELGRDFALKLMHQRFSSDPALAQRFRREALATSRIGHPNIVDVVDFGSTAEGQFYFTMELLAGDTLAHALRTGGPFTPQRVVAVARQLASALVAAHAAGVVHRDLKPENVMLLQRPGAGEVVKVLDFGIARFQDPEGGDHRLTTGNAVLGTPQYMSPEQAAGLPADARADLYALGLICHELLTGRPTFTAETASLVMVKQISQPAPPLPREVPAGLRRLVAQLLEKKPDARPQTMAEVLAALESQALATPTSRAAPRVAAALAGLLGLVGLAWAWSRPPPPPPALPTAPLAVPATISPPPSPAPADAGTPATEPALASVTLDSEPTGARVTVDGVERGSTPLALHGPAGAALVVVVSKAGHRPRTLTVGLDGGLVPTVVLAPLPKAAATPAPAIKAWNDSE